MGSENEGLSRTGVNATRRWRIAPTLILCASLLCAHSTLAQFTQQGPKLVGAGAIGDALQGRSVSISADGNTAIVGGDGDSFSPFDDVNPDPGSLGAAWIWTRSSGVWVQGPKLVGSGAVRAAQGNAVSISADGNTAIVGGPFDNGDVGAAWIWTRSGGAWSQQGPKLVGSGALKVARQGWSVALSADGQTALVGGSFDDANTGAAWVWTKSGGVWSQQGPKLVGSGPTFNAGQGSAVALSADGNTALIGGEGVWIWSRSGGVWTQQGSRLIESGGGYSVALSADGSAALVGGGRGGTASFWTRNGSVWSQGGTLVASNPVLPVSLSADGNTAVGGAPTYSNYAGAVWVWKRSEGVWTSGTQLIGADAVAGAGWNPQQGVSVALSGDGNTLIFGGNLDDSNGAAWVFSAYPVPAVSAWLLATLAGVLAMIGIWRIR